MDRITEIAPLVHIDSDTDFLGGQLILVDKPLQWTSFDVVNKVRFSLRRRLGVKKLKVGHAGTLDPLATGLLLIAVGKMTKKLQGLQGMDKKYEGAMRFGATTPTYDAEMQPDAKYDLSGLTMDVVMGKKAQFVGEIEQIPPIYSAVKKEGKRAYKYARQGQDLALQSRKIQVFSFELRELEWPEVGFEVHCAKGTYIRSLAHDLGQACGNGAYLTRLVRTEIGHYPLSEAWSLDQLIAAIQAGES